MLSAVILTTALVVADPPRETVVTTRVTSALVEVNAKRAARGLRPFVEDPLLTAAAQAAADFRAAHRLFGHTGNDMQFLPAGAAADSAGCAAYPAGMGWLTCCTYENYTFAGAAWAEGVDGRRYMHLFVRGGNPIPQAMPSSGVVVGVQAPPVSYTPGSYVGARVNVGTTRVHRRIFRH